MLPPHATPAAQPPPDAGAVPTAAPAGAPSNLRPCPHQVAGHMFENGKEGSYVDDTGRFYKPLPPGPRGDAETAFYQHVQAALAREGLDWEATARAARGAARSQPPFPPASWAAANAPLLAALPIYHGIVDRPAGGVLLALEDVAGPCRHPCVADIKIGASSAHPDDPPARVAQCAAKRGAAVQAALGFRLCGARAYRPATRDHRRWTKAECKALREGGAGAALAAWAAGRAGVLPAAAARLDALAAWASTQTEFAFCAASTLLVFDGGGGGEGGTRDVGGGPATVRLCDFAHTRSGTSRPDPNFHAGLVALAAALRAASAAGE